MALNWKVWKLYTISKEKKRGLGNLLPYQILHHLLHQLKLLEFITRDRNITQEEKFTPIFEMGFFSVGCVWKYQYIKFRLCVYRETVIEDRSSCAATSSSGDKCHLIYSA